MWLGGRWWSRMLLGVLVPVMMLGVVAAVWMVDEIGHRGRVARNVAVDGRAVGGLDEPALQEVVAALAFDRTAAPITILVGEERIEDAADDLGISVDVEATVDTVMSVRRDGPVLRRFAGWLESLGRTEAVDVALTFDAARAREVVAAHPLRTEHPPVDAAIRFDGEGLVVEPSVSGRTLAVDEIVGDLADATGEGFPVEVRARWVTVDPAISTGTADRFLAEVSDRIASGVIVDAEGTQRWVAPQDLYGWMQATGVDGELAWVFDREALHLHLEDLYDDLTVGGLRTVFEIVDGVPVAGEVGDDRRVCCGEAAVDSVIAVVTGEAFGVASLPLRDPSIDESHLAASQLGVEELVAGFTTHHACCQSRVDNIHRIADLLRGVVLEPGEQLSVNGFVGRRTVEGGFVPAGVIEQGRFEEAVGGGISQFATTLFNAAFLAGLDIPEYQSHSIYISRYPYGREATLSFPAPDLVIHNTTDYGVLIWPSYTETSITVDLYSTAHIRVEQGEQQIGAFRECTVVTTARLRTYPDGSTIADEFLATYRPGEGLDCDGRATPTG